MNAHLSTLLEREVSRKEFLGMSALAVASVAGLGSIIKLTTGKSFEQGFNAVHAGYGSSAYGGTSKNSLASAQMR